MSDENEEFDSDSEEDYYDSEEEEEEWSYDDAVENLYRCKGTCDGARSIDDMIRSFEFEIENLRDMKEKGWVLEGGMGDDYGNLVNVKAMEEKVARRKEERRQEREAQKAARKAARRKAKQEAEEEEKKKRATRTKAKGPAGKASAVEGGSSKKARK